MLISFVSIGCAGFLVIIITGLSGCAWWWRCAAVAVFTGAAVGLVHAVTEPATLGPADWWTALKTTPFRELILFWLVLLGMMARELSLAIEQREKQGAKAGANSRLKIDKWQFVYPMLFTIPTFGGLLAHIQGDTLTVAEGVLAFQTGFFWQTILGRRRPGKRH